MTDILRELNRCYDLRFERLDFLRDAGSTSYAAYSGDTRYFLRSLKPAFYDTAISGAEIQFFLQRRDFSVPHIILANGALPYARTDGALFILYEFIDGNDADSEVDAEAAGSLIGQLHREISGYPGTLTERGKWFFVERYIDILRRKEYAKADEFAAYGEALWSKVANLPRGYCHGDMYDGNLLKTTDGKLLVLDFDTSCTAFPMYDLTLFCNRTHYFEFREQGRDDSRRVFERFLEQYVKYSALTDAEIGSFYDMIALYHFALQATVIENYGLDCVDGAFLDKQLDWLYRWQRQCAL